MPQGNYTVKGDWKRCGLSRRLRVPHLLSGCVWYREFYVDGWETEKVPWYAKKSYL